MTSFLFSDLSVSPKLSELPYSFSPPPLFYLLPCFRVLVCIRLRLHTCFLTVLSTSRKLYQFPLFLPFTLSFFIVSSPGNSSLVHTCLCLPAFLGLNNVKYIFLCYRYHNQFSFYFSYLPSSLYRHYMILLFLFFFFASFSSLFFFIE